MIVETIKCDKCKKDLSDPWMTFEWKDGNQSHICKECTKYFNKWLKEPVEEEYPLTFKEAMMAMLDGKVVVWERYPDVYQSFQDGQFVIKNTHGNWMVTGAFNTEKREGKWKVVE